MSVDLFIDTNVFIYQPYTRNPRKHAIADAIVGEALGIGSLRIEKPFRK